ncbi:MAG: DUF4352 domain-containing protein [Candidatus Viridilinea halotolerans]|uniref:DUF4352 domain-containing protein n=1 Tax=Candidatus Viridilinea halotolerans TaxID=2491704 RepID=A0A426U0U0_9CHLR|nr:MAG: DUF4352 domain-containing protein [Candidatus Viridilinea halotolerans]
MAKLNLEQLLQTGAFAARGGKRVAARALFLALSREHPHDLRVWQGLAATAADVDEQRMALERIIALDPHHERALAALARLVPLATLPRVVPPAVESAPPGAKEAALPQRSPFPMLNLIALVLIVLLLAVVGMVLGGNLGLNQRAAAPLATPILGGSTAAVPALAITTLPETVATSAVTPTASPVPTPLTTELALGTLVDYDGWSVTLLQPDYALFLDGALGDWQPEGRFVLAVVALSNNSSAPRYVPPAFFQLIDRDGYRYSPLPGASSAYLALFERGQRGDLALEDRFAAQSGMLSVPLLFDVPRAATGLRLTTPATGSAGWPIGGGSPVLPMGP